MASEAEFALSCAAYKTLRAALLPLLLVLPTGTLLLASSRCGDLAHT